MGRPRKRPSNRSSSSFLSVTDSSAAIDDSVSEVEFSSKRRKTRKSKLKKNVFIAPTVRQTRSSFRSPPQLPTVHLESGSVESSRKSFSPFKHEVSTVSQHALDPEASKESPSEANSVLHREQPDSSPIGRKMYKRRRSSERLVHFDTDLSNPEDTHDSAQPLSHDATGTSDRLDRFEQRATKQPYSGSDDDEPSSTVAKRLRPRPPEAMVRYRQFRPYRRSKSFLSSDDDDERKRQLRRLERNRETRLMLRSQGARISRSRLRNRGLAEAQGANREEEEEGHGDGEEEEEEHHTSDTRRYPVRNRRHTAVYQVEYAQNSHHGPTRNWLSGTGYENGRRRRRHRSSHHHRGLHDFGGGGGGGAGSSTSSSSSTDDSASDLSAPDSPAAAAASTTYRKGSHASWNRAQPGATNDGQPSSMVSVDKDEVRFARRCEKSIIHSRSELMPINMKRNDLASKSTLKDRLLSGTSLADIEPMSIDESVGFEQVGGHENHIMALKESIILPLMYPEIFSQFGIDPPRGVLFSGPPGTGKTLLARALANECTRMTNADDPVRRRPIAFFMRKGADCLSKWVGESERQLRLLFDQAYRMRPSIIFFDEIDGLAPVRSSKQDQIHSSIVSTLLSLMDGLDQRAEVVIIGATNRPDSIDPALRRPGRFDREFTFGLPSEAVRQRILQVHTAKWEPKPSPELLQQLAYATGNFSGADLKALATEACLCCLRRQYPQVYQSRVKLALEHKYLVVSRDDWIRALQLVRPSNDRSDLDAVAGGMAPSATALASTRRTTLSPSLTPLLATTVNRLVDLFTMAFRQATPTVNADLPRSVTFDSILASAKPSPPNLVLSALQCYSKLLLVGDLPDCVVSAVWHRLELVQVYTVNLTNLVAFPSTVGMCAEAALAQILSTVKRYVRSPPQTAISGPLTHHEEDSRAVRGCVIFIPHVDALFHRLPHHTACYLVDRLQSLLHELAAEAMHTTACPAFNTGTTMDLAQTIVPNACRLLLVATVRNHSPPHLKGSMPEVAVGPPVSQKAPAPPHLVDGLPTTTQRGNSLSSVGRGQMRRVNENWSPVRQPSPRTAFTTSPSGPLPSEKLCNGIVRRRRISSGSGRNSSRHSDMTSPGSTGPPPISAPVLPNGHLPPESNLMFCPGEPGAFHEPDEQSLSDEASSSDSSYLSSIVNRRLSVLSPLQKTQLINRSSQPPVLPPANAIRSTVSTFPRHGRSSRLLNRLFSRASTVQLHLSPPSKEARAAYFEPVLIQWALRIGTGDLDSRNQDIREDRPPSPIPVPESPDTANTSQRQPTILTQEELEELERKEAQLFRRLRQVLRRVVAHLARHRRFAVFARPVQVDEAPDYYEVIEQPMDLGTIRDRIDADQYRNVEDFMKDIELIYYNALEYNPANVPRSRDIRSRASEFWDEACLQLEEELHPPDLNELCKEAAEAQAIRAKTSKELASAARGSHVDKTDPAVTTTTTSHARSTGSARSVKNVPAPEVIVKLHPMPSGGRYSRRLHGQPPILEPKDVQLLQNTNRRRSASFSQSLGTSANNSAESSLAIRASLDQTPAVDLDRSSDSMLMISSVPSPVRPEPIANSVTSPSRSESKISCSQTAGSSSPPLEPPHATSSPDISQSPRIESTRQSYLNETIGVNKDKLTAFHQVVVNGTAGWSINQLIRLHSEFCSVLSTHRHNSVSFLTEDLERVFNAYLKQNTGVELQF